MSDYFRSAYERARARFSPEQWLVLDPRQITEAIYREMRQIDAETAAASRHQEAGKPTGKVTD